jgi:thiol:disulfide interchange protein DsbD
MFLGVVFASGPAQTTRAAEAKPAEKDSNKRLRPKQVTLTPSVRPAEAKPGDTVTLQVDVKLEPGWHIYKVEKVVGEPGDGPRSTTFDLFDLAGLKPAGEWTASKPVIQKAEKAFDNKVLEFYEDEVTFRIPLQIPKDTPPGKKTLRVQAGYQICDANRCMFPGQWTLPDVELTVLAGDGTAATPASAPAVAVAAKPPAAAEPAPAAAPAPSIKDTNKRLEPKQAVLTPSVKPAEAKPGDTVTFEVQVKLEPGWHIFKFDKAAEDPDGGPRNTTFDLFNLGGLKLAGEWRASKPTLRKVEKAFDSKVLEFFEDEVTFRVPLQIPKEISPGKKTLRVQAGYQICDAASCKQPGQWTLPDVALTIVAADGAAAAPASEPAPAVAKPGAVAESAPVKPAASAELAPAAPPAQAAAQAPAAAAPAKAADAEPASEIAERAEQGILAFLLFSAGGGLLALAMPCVWPMVPITVNFFVKQGHKQKGKTTGLAIAYCLAIIGVFTSVGVLVSFFFSATALQDLANNGWLNAIVAILFLAFGLSLLGLYEIQLPSFLLNASARGESYGGMIGVMFMALTLTITSFTCTFPVVGGLIVMAAGGKFFYPIIGLATFSAVLALPFFLLALAPGLLAKMPKSGDWMNAIKVVGGLVEIGAAFKFINTAEIGFGAVPEDAIFDAPLVLSAWVGLAIVCGLYLLGVFRTDHDHEEVRIGPGRLIFGSMFIGLALFFAPALFGHPPKSPLWDLIAGILPPDVGDLEAPVAVAQGGHGGAIKATSPDPEVAERQQKSFHGVSWGLSYDEALARAKAENKPILVDFTGVNCANCRTMEQSVMPRKEIVNLLSQFVTVQLYTDFVPIASITKQQRSELAEKNQLLLLDLTRDPSNPFYAALDTNGKPLRSTGGLKPAKVFAKFLNDALNDYQSKGKVAQAGPGN